ncbi:MAG TPA: phosphotransferase, partial [Candidatus Melainabacteria bacterium]|nr:phosphotransferase [Candidatus Melainabacteria bacterium]
ERVLVPSISNSARLYMTAHHGSVTALFLEDLGNEYLTEHATAEIAQLFGEELAKMHRSYTYRMAEIIDSGIMRNLETPNIEPFTEKLVEGLMRLGNLDAVRKKTLLDAASFCKSKLKDEPPTLVHGDLYAENIVLRKDELYLFDWSWFTSIGPCMIDFASMVSDHPKNGIFRNYSKEFAEAYCFESGRKPDEILELASCGAILERLLFLSWLEERKSLGVLGTTVGHVDNLIEKVIGQIEDKLKG